jgi:hypothetical protein
VASALRESEIVNGWDEATTAVMAHSLLGTVAVVSGAAETLRSSWDSLDSNQPEVMLEMIISQSRHLTASLRDLARGLPPDVEAFLDDLDSQRPV